MRQATAVARWRSCRCSRLCEAHPRIGGSEILNELESCLPLLFFSTRLYMQKVSRMAPVYICCSSQTCMVGGSKWENLGNKQEAAPVLYPMRKPTGRTRVFSVGLCEAVHSPRAARKMHHTFSLEALFDSSGETECYYPLQPLTVCGVHYFAIQSLH